MNRKMSEECRNDVKNSWSKDRVVDTAKRASSAKRNNAWVNWSPIARVQGVAAMHVAVENGWVEKSSMCF